MLSGFLEVFANMTSGVPLFQAEVLRRVFTALLAKTHNQVQLLSLKSLYLWKPEDMMPYKTHLENLIDDEKYRDELTFFTIDDDLGQVKQAHRPGLVPVLSRILYAKVVQRKVLGAKTSLAQRRATVLAFFAGMRPEEMRVCLEVARVRRGCGNKEVQAIACCSACFTTLCFRPRPGAAVGGEWAMRRASERRGGCVRLGSLTC